MITNEGEIRIALQGVLISVLALNGYWEWAVLVLLILLPWKPIFAVMAYLAQPVVDWRLQKARDRHGKGMAQIEHELDALLRASSAAAPPACGPAVKAPGSQKLPSHRVLPRTVEPFRADCAGESKPRPLPETAQNLSAAVAILPVIKDHVQNLPQGVFHNMDLEVEEVKFHGETADAYVRFQSPNVVGLVIRQRYVLRKAGNQWAVESRQPANGGARMPPPVPPTDRGLRWLT
jgi:hypothetical protein